MAPYVNLLRSWFSADTLELTTSRLYPLEYLAGCWTYVTCKMSPAVIIFLKLSLRRNQRVQLVATLPLLKLLQYWLVRICTSNTTSATTYYQWKLLLKIPIIIHADFSQIQYEMLLWKLEWLHLHSRWCQRNRFLVFVRNISFRMHACGEDWSFDAENISIKKVPHCISEGAQIAVGNCYVYTSNNTCLVYNNWVQRQHVSFYNPKKTTLCRPIIGEMSSRTTASLVPRSNPSGTVWPFSNLACKV